MRILKNSFTSNRPIKEPSFEDLKFSELGIHVNDSQPSPYIRTIKDIRKSLREVSSEQLSLEGEIIRRFCLMGTGDLIQRPRESSIYDWSQTLRFTLISYLVNLFFDERGSFELRKEVVELSRSELWGNFIHLELIPNLYQYGCRTPNNKNVRIYFKDDYSMGVDEDFQGAQLRSEQYTNARLIGDGSMVLTGLRKNMLRDSLYNFLLGETNPTVNSKYKVSLSKYLASCGLTGKVMDDTLGMLKAGNYKEVGYSLEVWSGEKLADAYDWRHYWKKDRMYTMGSCMTFPNAENFWKPDAEHLQLYTWAPERFKVAVLLKNGDVYARQLLIKPDNHEWYSSCNIYAKDDQMRVILKSALKEEGICEGGISSLIDFPTLTLPKTADPNKMGASLPYLDDFKYIAKTKEGDYVICEEHPSSCVSAHPTDELGRNYFTGYKETRNLCKDCGETYYPEELRVNDSGETLCHVCFDS